MSMTMDIPVAALLRLDLPPSLDDAEARRVAEAEALRRIRAVRGVIEARIDDPSARRDDEPDA